MARRFDEQATAAAVVEQATAVRDWVRTLPDERWTDPTDLAGWTVAELVAHLTQTLRTVAALEPATGKPVPVAAYLARLPDAAAQIRDREVAAAAGKPPDQLRTDLDAALAAVLPAAITLPPVVLAPRGPIRAGDFLATRTVELTVHADDLSRALPDLPPAPLATSALRIAVRLLADVLADRAPGKSVEVRIPPYAAVQCIEGPRHTRGTPPTVVETDPLTWLRLATGRLTWATATAATSDNRISASGQRSDLSAHLPVLC